MKAQEYINSGYLHIVDIDLKSFFDEVDHCIEGKVFIHHSAVHFLTGGPVQFSPGIYKRSENTHRQGFNR
jgi:hypothetical protein